MQVVVVEDDPGIGTSLARTLEGQGYEVTWATTAVEGLAAVRSTTALVILDLGLPDADGLDVCRQLRSAGLRLHRFTRPPASAMASASPATRIATSPMAGCRR